VESGTLARPRCPTNKGQVKLWWTHFRETRVSPGNAVIAHVVFNDKFRRLEAILAEWLLVRGGRI
jgi:hypothetical protein